MAAVMHHKSDFLQLCVPSCDEDGSCPSPFALIILNNTLPWFTPCLWSKAKICICADGGANRVYDEMTAFLPGEDRIKVRERFKPDVIKGDLDSIRPEVKEYYSNMGTDIIDEAKDQDTTDLHKCMSFIRNYEKIEKNNLKVIVLGALGGRLDHEFANFNVLYSFSDVRIILANEESVAFLLPKNINHEIAIDNRFEGPHCGLIPLGRPSEKTTTTGLRWNLDNSAMCFGGLISTSNLLDSHIMTVVSDTDLLCTISTKRLKNCDVRNAVTECKN